ncbi:MAG: hypothetical protein J6Y96_01345, partial [Mycoplasma sp.]|nr:hypothetical protein [Mycoplasma sp.]
VSLQSKDITLTISKKNSELTNSIKYINYSTNNLTNDDKKDITDISFDFITFVDFNLDYDEYDKGDKDVAKNEIKIRNFNVGYKHHALGDEHSFDVPEMIKNNIYDQINKDGDDYSGITNRISNNYYNKLNLSYQAALSGKIIREMELYNAIKDKKTAIDNWRVFFAVISVVLNVFELLVIATLIIFSFYKWKKNQIGKKICYLITTSFELLLCIIAFLNALNYSVECFTTVTDYMDGVAKYIHPDDKDENKGTIDNETPFAKRLIDDNKYFFTPVDNPSQTANAKELFEKEFEKTNQKKEIWNYYHNYDKQPSGYQKKDNWDDEKEANKQFINEPYYQYREYDKFYDKIKSETIKIANLIEMILIQAVVMALVTIVIVVVAIYMWKRGFFNVVQDIPINQQEVELKDISENVKNSNDNLHISMDEIEVDNDFSNRSSAAITFDIDREIKPEVEKEEFNYIINMVKEQKENGLSYICDTLGFDQLNDKDIADAINNHHIQIFVSSKMVDNNDVFNHFYADVGKNMYYKGKISFTDPKQGKVTGYIYFFTSYSSFKYRTGYYNGVNLNWNK